MILITGAAGKTGRTVIQALTASGQIVRALVRRAEQVAAVEAAGAQQVEVGDLRDEATLVRAMHGVRAIYHICPNVHPDEFVIGMTAIAAARAAHVERFAFHSVLHPQVEAMPHHWNKLRIEEALFESGLAFTILQPAAYMQNMLAEWQAIIREGVYRVPYSVDAPFSPVDLEDVAEAAAIVLTQAGHTGAIYELAGPEVLTPAAMAEILSQRMRRPVQAEQIAVEAWARDAERAGLNTYAIGTLIKMFRYYDQHGLWGNPGVLSHLLTRAPTRFAAFVERSLRESVT